MRVEHERCDAQGEDGEPEVQEVGRPDSHGGVEQQQEVTHTHVDAGSGETGVEDGERDTRRRETTTCRDVSSTTEGEIVEDRVAVDLGGEDLEDRGP